MVLRGIFIMLVDSDSSSEKKEKRPKKLEFIIPQDNASKPHTTAKISIRIKREPKRTTQEYLKILKILNSLLSNPSISEAQRRDYCKSQRYFMKLYLKQIQNPLDE
ncbi:MAG: hypothetical protein BAJALOKI1v1_430015 [Promethearchaeota archaeon]|nr:MAG: hypothetical protein BAJALOKI1v1_430015 [Candidatus Lokiarchaeota archaeon]